MSMLLISKRDYQKLLIFKEILYSRSGIHVNLLAKEYKLSKSTIFRYLMDLEKDIKEAFPESEVDFSVSMSTQKETGAYMVYVSGTTNAYIIDYLRLYYMKRNTLFVILEHLLMKRYPSASALSYDTNLSMSTIYKQLNELQKILDAFNISISFDAEKGNFVGDEIGLRYFIYCTYFYMYKTTDKKLLKFNCFKNTENWNFLLDELNNEHPLSLSQKTKLQLVYGVNFQRIVKRKQNINLSDGFYRDIMLFSENYLTNVNFEKQWDLLDSQKEHERAFLIYGLCGLVYDINTFEGKKQIVEAYQKSNLEVARQVEQILADFYIEFDINPSIEGYIRGYYLLLIYLIYMRYIHINTFQYVEVEDIFEKKSTLRHILGIYDRLYEFAETELFKLYIYSDYWQQETIQHLAYILLAIYEFDYAAKTSKIFVQFSKNLFLGEIIKRRISNFFSKEQVEFTDNPTIADIIVADTYEGITIKSDAYRLYTTDYAWEDLIPNISKYLYKNSFV